MALKTPVSDRFAKIGREKAWDIALAAYLRVKDLLPEGEHKELAREFYICAREWWKDPRGSSWRPQHASCALCECLLARLSFVFGRDSEEFKREMDAQNKALEEAERA